MPDARHRLGRGGRTALSRGPGEEPLVAGSARAEGGSSSCPRITYSSTASGSVGVVGCPVLRFIHACETPSGGRKGSTGLSPRLCFMKSTQIGAAIFPAVRSEERRVGK